MYYNVYSKRFNVVIFRCHAQKRCTPSPSHLHSVRSPTKNLARVELKGFECRCSVCNSPCDSFPPSHTICLVIFQQSSINNLFWSHFTFACCCRCCLSCLLPLKPLSNLCPPCRTNFGSAAVSNPPKSLCGLHHSFFNVRQQRLVRDVSRQT